MFVQCFSKSTILGLTFGVFLAGYAAFAFTPPTQAPPGGNVPAPLNVGPADQTKTGGLLSVFGLWVNQSLGVTGGATLGGILNLQGNKIINVRSPSTSGDVATWDYVNSATESLLRRIEVLEAAGRSGKQIFTTSGTFTVPTGITQVRVSLVGGGGGGAGGESTGGWVQGASGGNGRTSSFGGYVSVTGGSGGFNTGGGGSGGSPGGNAGGSSVTTAPCGSLESGAGGIGGRGNDGFGSNVGGGGTGGNGGCGGGVRAGIGGGGGGSGGIIVSQNVVVTAGQQVSVNVGSGGSGGFGGRSGQDYGNGTPGGGGNGGIIVVEW